MKTLLFGFLLITLLALPRNTQCRIGETLEESKARYGKPVEIKKDTGGRETQFDCGNAFRPGSGWGDRVLRK
jgi:hypothetical protein